MHIGHTQRDSQDVCLDHKTARRQIVNSKLDQLLSSINQLCIAPSATMASPSDCLPELDVRNIKIVQQIRSAPASIIYKIRVCGKLRLMKLFHDNGDEGYAENGRDLNRFRCESRAYGNLQKFGVCGTGLVPFFYGYIDRVDPYAFDPPLIDFTLDKFQPSAVILEYLPEAKRLNCVNYSEEMFHYAVNGIKAIHDAHIHHHDIYPKNVLVVSGGRLVWIDFDVSMTFDTMGSREKVLCDHEVELVESFGRLLKEYQEEGLPPNTKFY